ncbi:MAG: hypothetical protein B6D62_01995 [Candidatus Cloacimonas sp. 4484_275]|nr:MAG: hypothetical protein B6D62_01995 [Candidatus Cloacimonas sp. 4484_275]
MDFNTFVFIWILVVIIIIFLYIRHRKKTVRDPVIKRLRHKVKKRNLKKHLKYRREKGYLENNKHHD